MTRPRCLLVLLACAAGCGGQPHRLAPVSGRITLNGQPLANAAVHFLPVGSREGDAGPTAHGRTDAGGRYTLRVDGERSGAVVGRNRVYVTTILDEVKGEQPDAGGKLVRDRVPLRYNMDTTLTCDVPPQGTADANFDLTAP